MEKGYMISDASKMLEVENHVLRYWEEELELPIPRNELGHRFYREAELKLLRTVKELKEQGFQLKAIKKLLPDLGRLEEMEPQALYQLREELNAQVLQESLEHTRGCVTPIEHARDRYEKRQKTWQERSFEMEQAKERRASFSYGKTQAASLERLRQFEMMLQQMVESSVRESARESEQRICEQVTEKLQKEMNYLSMQREEIQEKQIRLLQEILQQVRREETGDEAEGKNAAENAEPQMGTADLPEASREIAASQEMPVQGKETGRKSRRRGAGKMRRKKLFAKSVSS